MELSKAKSDWDKLKEERTATQKEGNKGGDKWNWPNSWAKENLCVAISKGEITKNHSYDEIHMWHPEVQSMDRSKLPG